MGWISKRRMRTGRSIGGVISAEKRKAPLRRIVAVLRPARGLFDRDHVELECGHTAFARGIFRARCLRCARASAGDRPGPESDT